MLNIPSANDLRRAAAISEKIAALQAELNSLLGSGGAAAAAPARRRGRRSNAEIAAAAAAAAASGEETSTRRRKRRKLSPEARARIVAAVKARWARERAQKGSK